MKATKILFFFVFLGNICNGQTKNAENYYPLYETSNTANYYKMENGSYVTYYVTDKFKFEDHKYYTMFTQYSWGDIDTAYYREDDQNYYHYDPKVNKESIVLPKKVTMSQKWLEADSSWSYQVIGIDKELQTPARKYTGLIVIECVQLTGRDREKYRVYHLYYAEGIGMVASVNKGKLMSYLAEVKRIQKVK